MTPRRLSRRQHHGQAHGFNDRDNVVGMHPASGRGVVQGRITDRHLPMAEACFPGIRRFYEQMDRKPATFLQLVWEFEEMRNAKRKSAPKRRRR
ncbi:MAG: hypothetical protein R3B48_23290 [Kofleriaceae bacterium]